VSPTSVQFKEGEGKEGHCEDKEKLIKTDYSI
jgi:hypothetical protein